jgi:hypothetical protein
MVKPLGVVNAGPKPKKADNFRGSHDRPVLDRVWQTILLDFFTVTPAVPDRPIDLTYKYLVEDHMIRDGDRVKTRLKSHKIT